MEPIKRRRVTSRRRVVHACETCRRRKIKCDQGRPVCGQCTEVSRQCAYADSPGQQGGSVTNFVTAITKHSDHAEPYRVEEDDAGPETLTQQQNGVMLSTGTRHRYVSRSSWLPDVLAASDGQTPGRETANTILVSEVAVESTTALPPQDVTMKNWLLALPTSELDRLTNWFSEHCFLVATVLTAPELEVLRSKCLCSDDVDADEDDLVLLAAVCYIAALSIEIWSPLANLSRPSHQWKIVVESAIKNRRGPPSLQQIKVLVFFAMSSISEDLGTPCCPSVGPTAILVRTAQLAGLHREPSKLSENLSHEKCDERRRLFWVIFDIDVVFSLAHGLPALIDRSGYDVFALTCDNEQSVNHGIRFLIHKIEADRIFSQVLDTMYGVKPLSRPVFDELVDAATRYQDRMEALTGWEGASARYVQWCLKLVAHRLVFTIHQFYLRTDRLSASRERALTSSLAFVEGFITCVMDFTFAPLRWITDHFNVFHPCAIVLQDLILHPNSAEAARSRAVLDSCFSQLSNPVDAKWQMLERLRQRAWAVNGWAGPGEDDEAVAAAVGEDIDLGTVAGLADWDALLEPGVFAVSGFD